MDLIGAARLIETSSDYRLLRRVPAVKDWPLPPPSGELRQAIFLDTETTGLEDEDEVIELALLPFEYERDTGVITAVHVDRAIAALRQPSTLILPRKAAPFTASPTKMWPANPSTPHSSQRSSTTPNC